MGDEPKPKPQASRKRIPAERKEDVEALLRRTLILVGRLALRSKARVYPYEVATWEQELAFCLEDLNDMQVSGGFPDDRTGEGGASG